MKRSVKTQTPMRMTLAGGGTDVLWYSKLRGGAWISTALNLYVKVEVSGKGKGIPTNPIIEECLKKTCTKTPIAITVTSDVSAGSGLGGSGAFEVGLLNALYTFKGKHVTQLQLAREAADIEIVQLKKPVGPQDQYITALGGIRYFEVDTSGNVSQQPLKISKSTIETLQENLLFFQTGIGHDTASVLGDQKKQSDVIHSLNKIKALGLEVKKWLLNGRVDDVGRSFHTHWLIKRGLSKKVSSSQIDDWYEEGIKAGALGGKIMGAGGGGWFVFYVAKQKNKFRDRMARLGLVVRKVGFDWYGTRVIEK